MPTTHSIFHVEDFQKIILHSMGRYCVAGGYINTKRGQQSIKLYVQHDTVSTINIIFTDGRNCSDLERNSIIKCDVANIFQCASNCLRCKWQIFKSSVHIHSCTIVQTDNRRYQHTSL